MQLVAGEKIHQVTCKTKVFLFGNVFLLNQQQFFTLSNSDVCHQQNKKMRV